MTKIKIYTEEQLLNTIIAVRFYDDVEDDGKVANERIEKHLKALQPIELPSDEEIEEVADIVYGFNNNFETNVKEYKAFKHGAKYIINKIQGGNK